MAEPTYPQDGSIIDIVDRQPRRNLHGVTWHIHSDAMLDEIARLHHDRDQAKAALTELLMAHPRLETDEHFALACLALQ